MLKKTMIVLSFLFISSIQAKVFDSFICYTERDMAVIYGIKQDIMSHSSMNVHYGKLETNPLVMPLNITKFDRVNSTAEATSVDPETGNTILKISIQGMMGLVYLDLRDFAGSEETLFEEVDAMCYFGYVQD